LAARRVKALQADRAVQTVLTVTLILAETVTVVEEVYTAAAQVKVLVAEAALVVVVLCVLFGAITATSHQQTPATYECAGF
jgi:hypothetical protein